VAQIVFGSGGEVAQCLPGELGRHRSYMGAASRLGHERGGLLKKYHNCGSGGGGHEKSSNHWI
jgi:hypothetical protein